jgi:lipoate-protein ligase A
MYYVDNEGVSDPRLNLAIEEHLLRHVALEEPILLFYVNEPSVIIGRNQNSSEEIDAGFVKKEGIHVVRRLSGGGAVYHDLGNLNFSFVTSGKEGLHDFARFTGPVVTVLRRLGVEAELKGKSDIFAAGKKVSGNAQYAAVGRMFSHGTILFDTNLEKMLRALNPGGATIESRAVQSIRNFVTNIRELLDQEMDILELKGAILEEVFQGKPPTRLELELADWQQIRRISAERYANWEWNYGRAPRFNLRKSERLPAGKFDVFIDVAQGRVQSIRLYGDFAGLRPVAELEASLAGLRYDREAVEQALEDVDLDAYFTGVGLNEFINLLF